MRQVLQLNQYTASNRPLYWYQIATTNVIMSHQSDRQSQIRPLSVMKKNGLDRRSSPIHPPSGEGSYIFSLRRCPLQAAQLVPLESFVHSDPFESLKPLEIGLGLQQSRETRTNYEGNRQWWLEWNS